MNYLRCINTIVTECGFTPEDEELQECSKTGLEGFAFQVVSKWPLSLLFNQKIIGCYQMLFRHLLNCKHVDRRLCQYVLLLSETVSLSISRKNINLILIFRYFPKLTLIKQFNLFLNISIKARLIL